MMLTATSTAQEAKRLIDAVERRWEASERYLDASADTLDPDPSEAEAAFADVEDALATLAAVQERAATRILSILEDHDPRRRDALDAAVEQIVSPIQAEQAI